MDGLVLLLIACLGIHRVFGEIVVNVTCTHNTWLIDSDTGQSPCYVFAELMGQCYNNNFTILPDGTALALNYYTGQGPVSLDIPCYCTTVQYQLLSACFACLDYPAETWDEYAAACHVVSPVVGYTDFTLPADAIIPAYAMLQTTEDFNLTLVDQIFWDHLPDTVPTATVPVVLSGSIVGAVLPGTASDVFSTSWLTSGITAAPTSTTQSSTSSSSQLSTSNSGALTSPGTSPSAGTNNSTNGAGGTSPTASSRSSQTGSSDNPSPSGAPLGAIIGGVVGGVALLLAILIAIVLLCRKRNRPRPRSQYRVSLASDNAFLPALPEAAPWSPLPPDPAPWFRPGMEPPATRPKTGAGTAAHATLNWIRSSMHQLREEALPYVWGSANIRSGPEKPSEQRARHDHGDATLEQVRAPVTREPPLSGLDRVATLNYSRGGTPPPQYEELSRRGTLPHNRSPQPQSFPAGPSSSRRHQDPGHGREKFVWKPSRQPGHSYPSLVDIARIRGQGAVVLLDDGESS